MSGRSAHPGGNAAAYEPLRAIMTRCGATCSPRDFYWAVNEAYHTAESAHYDAIHADHFEGLRDVWGRLLGPLAACGKKLRILDVGAGTGLVRSYLSESCGNAVGQITLLDPCEAMLDRSRAKERPGMPRCEYLLGDIDAVPTTRTYDVITANSVLHHIVDLPDFFGKALRLLMPGGWLMTAHDPRAEAREDPVCRNRIREARARRAPSAWGRLRAIGGTWARRVLRRPLQTPLSAATSAPLLARGLIKVPLDMACIWAVTDFHVPGQPGDLGKGISKSQLMHWLTGCELQDYFTYQFRGLPWHVLADDEREEERAWLKAGDDHGTLFAARWRKHGRSSHGDGCDPHVHARECACRDDRAGSCAISCS